MIEVINHLLAGNAEDWGRHWTWSEECYQQKCNGGNCQDKWSTMNSLRRVGGMEVRGRTYALKRPQWCVKQTIAVLYDSVEDIHWQWNYKARYRSNYHKIRIVRTGMTVHACNLSYLRSRDGRIVAWGQPGGKGKWDHISKTSWTGASCP